MAKVLMLNYEKCTGCRTCELVCSVEHEGAVNPAKSRIKSVKWETEGLFVPTGCQQCVDAPCMAVCPVKAISRDEELNMNRLNHEVCIGCRMCVAACPFGAMNFNVDTKRVFKCDLCHGEPQCAQFCQAKAVEYVEATTQSEVKRRSAAEKLTAAIQKGAALTAGAAQ
jgi:carbon-monoxide dehydrogenase iron sulfur subunit